MINHVIRARFKTGWRRHACVALCACACALWNPAWAVDEVAVLVLTASQKVVERRYEEAISLYTQAIAQAPNRADVYLQRAFVYREMQQPGPLQADAIVAVKLAETVISAGRPRARDYYIRGSAYRLLKRFPEARVDLETAIRMKNEPRWKIDLQALALEERMK